MHCFSDLENEIIFTIRLLRCEPLAMPQGAANLIIYNVYLIMLEKKKKKIMSYTVHRKSVTENNFAPWTSWIEMFPHLKRN